MKASLLALPLSLVLIAPALAQGTASAPATAAAANAPATTPPAPPPAQTPQGRRVQNDMERRVSELHDRLHITAAQQQQWDDFTTTMRQNAEHADQVFAQNRRTGQENALNDMRAYAAITQAHAQDVQNLLPKFEALYNVLSPDQKKSADAAFAQYEQQMMRGAGRARS